MQKQKHKRGKKETPKKTVEKKLKLNLKNERGPTMLFMNVSAHRKDHDQMVLPELGTSRKSSYLLLSS